MSSYAKPTDLVVHGAPAAMIADKAPEELQAALDAASTYADGFLRNRFTLPIVTPSVDLVMAVCQLAAWNLLRVRGFSPEDQTGQAIRMGFDDAMSWLKRVADGTTTPALTDSSPGASANTQTSGGAFVVQPQSSGQVDANGSPLLTIGAPRSRGWV